MAARASSVQAVTCERTAHGTRACGPAVDLRVARAAPRATSHCVLNKSAVAACAHPYLDVDGHRHRHLQARLQAGTAWRARAMRGAGGVRRSGTFARTVTTPRLPRDYPMVSQTLVKTLPRAPTVPGPPHLPIQLHAVLNAPWHAARVVQVLWRTGTHARAHMRGQACTRGSSHGCLRRCAGCAAAAPLGPRGRAQLAPTHARAQGRAVLRRRHAAPAATPAMAVRIA